MIGRLFRAHGEFCASHPWEVIVAMLTITACMLTVDTSSSTLDTSNGLSSATATAAAAAAAAAGATATSTVTPNGPAAPPPIIASGPQSASSSRHRPCHGWSQSCDDLEAEYNAADVILMTIVRCTAVLYCYYQFCKLHRQGSTYVLGIAGLFTVFSSFIFTTAIMKFLGSDLSDLKDALFFLLLVIDLSNSGRLAQLALSGSSQTEVTQNLARGLELLGPTISLDTIVGALLVGVGTLSGVQRLELLCMFGVLSVLVNYVVFMTFYPACLSLIFDLSRNGIDMSAVQERAKGSSLLKSLTEEEQKANPVLQRVKLIMSTGLMIVHIYSRIVFSSSDYDAVDKTLSPTLNLNVSNNRTDSGEITDIIIKWLTMSADHIVICIVLIALVVKFFCFDNRDPLQEQLRQSTTAKASQTTPLEDEKRETRSKQLVAVRTPRFTIEEQSSANAATQTELVCMRQRLVAPPTRPPRPLQECLELLNGTDDEADSAAGPNALSDEEVIAIVNAGGTHCPLYKIESVLADPERGIRIRRQIIASRAQMPMERMDMLPYQHFDYRRVMNACCENVLGYVPIPVGFAGPLLLDGEKHYVPMATTEGALVASTNRGCKALSVRGVRSVVEDVGMTRAPCVRFPSVARASEAKKWIEKDANYQQVKTEFDSTSRFGRLKECQIAMDGPQLYIRFVALTGDAMGMNMVSKGAEMALRCIKRQFHDMQIISLSGNFCCDKKPAAINWIKGRGKRVVAECTIPAATLRTVLKTDAKTLVECNKLKNMSGSAMAGTIGGNNAHAANMVTAVFLATGQDPAQNVTSSNCSTAMECWTDNNEDLYMTCTMPSLEVGTVGGGTGLPGQGACLDMLGLRGAHATQPGDNAKKLAQIVCATVMAGELSLMAALVNSDLVKSHMRHNR
ncbi:3-hydroxy-3-methylglutaryl-coenzyme A reductase isoform X2 [Drosophila grimshawi]|nr:3-hydroxy-3-methylglutaryl-coenzyme A reductase isoform X2 [Drosophila grimshawi]